MENLKWFAVQYNNIETNIEVTKCGCVRRLKKDWLPKNSSKFGEVDFSKLKLKNGYKRVSIQIKNNSRKVYFVHQLISAVFLDYKFNSQKNVIDHIDSNKLNNNLNNLRVITHRENMSKERTKKSGLPVGVYFHKKAKKYASQITINNKNFYLGLFKTIEQASKIYQEKLLTLNQNQ